MIEEKNSQSPWMSVPQLGEYLSLSKTQVYELIRTDALPSYRVKGRVLFHRDEVDEYVHSCKRVCRPADAVLMTVKEAAEVLGVTDIAVYQNITSGRLPCVYVQKRKMLPEDAVRRQVGRIGRRDTVKVVGSEFLCRYLEDNELKVGDLADRIGVHRRDISGTKYGSYAISEPSAQKIAAYFRLARNDMYDANGISYSLVGKKED